MTDHIQQAADYIRSETEKLDAPLDYGACLGIALHLHHIWRDGHSIPSHPVNVAQERRQRYEGGIDDWDDECIPGN
jgi:hypothetical protein